MNEIMSDNYSIMVIETYTKTKTDASTLAQIAQNAGAIGTDRYRLPPSKKVFKIPELEREWIVEILCSESMVNDMEEIIRKHHPESFPPISTQKIMLSKTSMESILNIGE